MVTASTLLSLWLLMDVGVGHAGGHANWCVGGPRAVPYIVPPPLPPYAGLYPLPFPWDFSFKDAYGAYYPNVSDYRPLFPPAGPPPAVVVPPGLPPTLAPGLPVVPGMAVPSLPGY